MSKSIVSRVIVVADNIIVDSFRNRFRKKNRKRLRNADATIISSNCVGGCIMHDLGMRFNTPFVNLWIEAGDYIKLLSNLGEYLKQQLEFIKLDGIDYPVAQLGDIKLYFQHYLTEDDASQKWYERLERISWDNLYIICSDRDGMTEELIEKYDKLPYDNKIIFVNKEYPQIKSAVYIRGFENESCVGSLMAYPKKYSGKRYYDQFDYTGWLNAEL